MRHDAEPTIEPEPTLPSRLAYFTCVAASAAVLFVLVSGVHAGAGKKDARLLVAQCWHQIEDRQASEDQLHDMRVACQQLESSLTAHVRPPSGAMVAAQEAD
ncbi:hypothetical protein [Xylophilus sp. GOD-11R]|uniref:hypothetical protein n=1 Tax=Xylophilus sp. GOD-11R TaxID=3089814 RepID=UPI00298C6493|nr:hypothetical protein [Xylophilus sp. GOD-11R]WPB55174.1 hypothetical protein R9X41_13530 [Xylophilus sp. GOD-11R]